MTLMRSVFGTLLALVALLMAMVFLGLIFALLYSLVIFAIAMIVSLAEPRSAKPVKRGPNPTERTIFATLWTVIAAWMAMGRFGPQDIAGPALSMIFTVIVIATAIILNIALKPDPITSLRDGSR